jgi:hypothetical protein
LTKEIGGSVESSGECENSEEKGGSQMIEPYDVMGVQTVIRKVLLDGKQSTRISRTH